MNLSLHGMDISPDKRKKVTFESAPILNDHTFGLDLHKQHQTKFSANHWLGYFYQISKGGGGHLRFWTFLKNCGPFSMPPGSEVQVA